MLILIFHTGSGCSAICRSCPYNEDLTPHAMETYQISHLALWRSELTR